MKRLCQRIWQEAKPIVFGDEVDRYLRNRGIALTNYPKTLAMLSGYATALVAIQLWPPLFSILNYMARLLTQSSALAAHGQAEMLHRPQPSGLLHLPLEVQPLLISRPRPHARAGLAHPRRHRQLSAVDGV